MRGGGPMDLLEQVQRMQEEMAQVQQSLAEEIVEVTVGGGAVRAVMTGSLNLKELHIDPDLLDPEDVDMLQDMIISAVNQAIAKAQELAAERMGAITGGLSIPGLF